MLSSSGRVVIGVRGGEMSEYGLCCWWWGCCGWYEDDSSDGSSRYGAYVGGEIWCGSAGRGFMVEMEEEGECWFGRGCEGACNCGCGVEGREDVGESWYGTSVVVVVFW